ncbi:MAG: hypothetical protein ACLU4N_11095 [Butyricimonas faecihominis]
MQEQVNGIVRRHIDVLKHNHIYNAAVLVVHIPTGQVRAYVGNGPKGVMTVEIKWILSLRTVVRGVF